LRNEDELCGHSNERTSLEKQAAGRCKLSGVEACVPWDRSTSVTDQVQIPQQARISPKAGSCRVALQI